MTGTGLPGEDARLGPAALGLLMPMHLRLCASGHIRGVGPTLLKLCGPALLGARFPEAFELLRPRPAGEAEAGALCGQRLQLRLRAAPRTALRGLAAPLAGQGVLVNLSFGIGLEAAVRDHALTGADFAPTDLAVELLYLQEAKGAVTEELRALNRRLHAARRAAEDRALTDPLTGLANRRALDLALAEAAAAAARGGRPFALVQIDLDHFKAVNDTAGHAAGDAVLAQVARVLAAATRHGDTVARTGGDEFVLILRDLVDPARLSALAARIVAGLEEPVLHEGRPCRVSASLGVALSSSYARPDPDRMLSDADRALYVSKRRGRARWTFFGPGMEEG